MYTLADMVTDDAQARAWEQVEADEQCRIMEQELARLDTRQRETLLAHTPDGFDTVKIAMIQNRDEKEVIADLESAREALR